MAAARVTVREDTGWVATGFPAADSQDWVSLDGIVFRCGPTGSGCP